jgi:hyperosmotically inducible protein
MKKTKLTKFARFVIPGVLLGAGCTALLAAPAPSTVKPLEDSVRKALVTIPYLSVFDDLSYRVDSGIVTLSGAVTQPCIKDYAEKAVQHLPGVAGIQDQIEVLPLSPVDDRIRVQTFRALNRTGSLYRYFMGTNPSIRIVVKNGHVTLDGVVGNAMDSQLAYMAANHVPGVFSVTNDLQTEIR